MRAHSAIAPRALAPRDDATDRIAQLFDAHHQALYRLARRLANNADDARDLVQDTFLRAAKNPRRVPLGHSHEEAWLVRVLVNLCRDQWRRSEVRTRSATRLNASLTTTSRAQECEVLAHTEIWRALNRLHPRRRAIVILHELEGTSTLAIAALLGISAATVRWHLFRGRRDLERILRPQLGETS
jgi:RNA polymerase sigma factor (sigma-70 family)